MADRFHHTMNSLHPKPKFEIEKPETTPNGLSLSLLDFKVTITEDGRNSFEFYKTSAKKPLFVHHQSAIPKKSKINFIRNEGKRIEDKCSTQTTSIKHQNMFDDILRMNRYPEDSIDQTKHPQRHQRNSPPPNVDWSYLKIPDTSNTKLCFLRNAVYQITCNNCNQHYIGSTTRFNHACVRECVNSENFSEKKHISICQNKDYKGIEIKTIVLENDPVNLRLSEAF